MKNKNQTFKIIKTFSDDKGESFSSGKVIPRDHVTVDNIVKLVNSGKLTDVSSIALLELIKQHEDRIKKFEGKK